MPVFNSVVFLFGMVGLVSGPGLAGSTLGQPAATVAGVIRTQSGTPIVGARVGIGGAQAVETDSLGRFEMAAPSGVAVVVEIAAFGFTPERLQLGVLSPGQRREIAATLRPLHLLEPIAVVARRSRPLLDTRDATTGGTIEAGDLAALPTDARDPIALLFAIPGVAQATSYFGDAPTLSFNGGNSLYTQYTLDGLDANEGFLGGPRVEVPLGAIQRIEALVNSYPASVGRSATGVVDIQTVAGGDRRQGELFAYWRPGRPLDAPNKVPFGGVPEAIARQQEGFGRFQLGGSLAGPLAQGRSYGAAAVEVTTENEDRIGSTALAPFLGTEDRTKVKAFGRVDHAWNDRQATTLRVAFSSVSRAGQGSGVITPEADITTRRVGSLTALTHRTSFGDRTSNTASIQFGTFRWFFPPTASDFTRPQVTVVTPGLAVQGVVGSSNFVFDETERQLQVRDMFQTSFGRHTIQVGADLVTSWFRLAAAGTNPNGSYLVVNDGNIVPPAGRPLTFADIPADARVLSYTVDASPQQVDLSQTLVGAFIADVWRVSPALTVQLGLRWDYDDLTKRGESTADLDNLQPRASFNWYQSARRVFRGGLGLFTGKFPYAIYSDAIQLGPDGNAVVTFAGSDAPAFGRGPTPAELRERRDALPPREVFETFGLGLEQPWSVQTTLGWQQQIGNDWAVSVDAVWTETRNLPRNVDLNPSSLRIGPTDLADRPCASAFDCPADGSRPVRPVAGSFRRLSTSESGGRARYFGLYTAARRRVGRVTLDANWTWSWAKNDTEDINFTAAEANCFGADRVDAVTGAACQSTEWAWANNDRRHHLTLRSSWDAGAGVRLSVIGDFQTGQPINRLAGSSTAAGNATFDLLGIGPVRGNAFLGNGPRFFGVPRNGERLPAYFDLRASVAYRMPIGNGLLIRIDGFNLFNRTNWAGYPIGLGGAGSRIQFGRPSDPVRLFSPGPPRQFQLSAQYQP
ncbi:MAG: TonB-dependent receptor [Gemmatimonadetes bacterium]|nr:TonB-dependent receptor [Gemmatimonadota bacterium]